jgi:plastocyanin
VLCKRNLLPALACCLAAALLAGCGGDEDGATGAAPSTTGLEPAASATAPASAVTVVHLKLLSFEPAELHVPAGSTVEWVDDNPITHTVTSGSYEVGADGLRTSEQADGTFDGDLAAEGDSFLHTFDAPGTYTYFCSIHKGMNATLVVDP